MESSTHKFIRWFQEFYLHEFPSLSKEFKMAEIEKVLLNNQKYITREDVVNFDGCVKCGRCCESQRCLDYDAKTKLCTRHDDPIHQFCIDYPWGDIEYGIAPLLLNCNYQLAFFINFFDQYFLQFVDGDNDAP